MRLALSLVAALTMLIGAGLAAVATGQPAGAEARLFVVGNSEEERLALARGKAETVANYEAFTLVEATDEDARRLSEAGAIEREDMREVELARESVDPAEQRPPLGRRDGPVLALVQFVGPVKDGWLTRLRELGVRIVGYAAQNAYVVHAERDEADDLGDLLDTDPAVRAVTEIRATDKIDRRVRATGRGAFTVQTITGADGAAARRALAVLGPKVRADSEVLGLRGTFVRADAARVRELASDPGVVAVEQYAEPRLYDEAAAQIVAGNLTGFAPTGPGYLAWLASKGFGAATFDFAIDITDEGIDTGALPGTHADFFERGNVSNPGRVDYKTDWTSDSNPEDCGGHGTNVASIAAGFNASTAPAARDAAGYAFGLGVAPRARLGASKIFNCDGDFDVTNPFDPFTDLVAGAYAGGARVSNNSWGADVAGDYNIDSREYDAFVRDARSATPGNQQLVEVFANGNAGPAAGTVGAPATAKNVISVGASEGVRAIGAVDGCGVSDAGADSARDVVGFSSRGPTDDGRTKPDVVAPGTHITGAQPQVGGAYNGSGTCDPQFPSGSAFYSLVSGTSQATPHVAGFAALIRDHHRRTVGAGVTPPSPAMTKALMVNTATSLAGGVNAGGNVPNNNQGWGRVDASAYLEPAVRHHVDQTVVLGSSGASQSDSFDVVDTGEPVRVTLVWTDPPGPTIGDAFVNDLNLEVTVGASTYRGNVFSGGQSTTGGTADPRNNVENVFLPAGTSGTFTVDVIGAAISGDGVPGNGDATDQDYALVVSNAAPAGSPRAAFTAGPDPAALNQSVSFDGSSSTDADGTITKHEWDLDGNGTFETDTGATPTTSRSYATRGTVLVGLRVTDDAAKVGTTTRALVVQGMTSAPVATFDASAATIDTGQSVDFDASAASDADGTVARWEWDIDGNGVFETDGGFTPTLTREFNTPGTFDVGLRVTDDEGASSTTTRTLEVKNRPPTASFIVPASPVAGQPAEFDASFSSDPDGTVASYVWDFTNDGSADATSSGPNVTHSFATSGQHTVRLRVIDDLGASAETTRSLTVSDPPAAPSPPPAPPPPGGGSGAGAGISVDTTAPRVSLRYRRTQRIRTLLGRRMSLLARCNESCRLGVDLSIRVRRGSSSVRASGHTRVIRVARARGSGRANRSKRLRLRASRRYARTLRRIRRTHATLTIRVVDRAGNRRTYRRRVTLRR